MSGVSDWAFVLALSIIGTLVTLYAIAAWVVIGLAVRDLVRGLQNKERRHE